MAIAAEDLKRLSALLDTALELDPAARERWLASLPQDALSPMLRRLLAQHDAAETGTPLDRSPLPPAPPARAVGDRVGPYELLRPIGHGGMGEVWLARRADGRLERQVAIKLPTAIAGRGERVRRFARERDILAALEHPHIARLYDAGVADDGTPYLALEFVAGVPVTEYCRQHASSLAARVALVVQVAQALQYAHTRLVVHRDLKPSNVLVTDDGRAVLLDFGIAKLLADDGDSEMTRVGGAALTPAYAAPEQLRGEPASTATDVYSLGVVLHELACGARPHAGEGRELERAVVDTEVPLPGGVPRDLAAVMLKALRKPPAERYATAAALADDLQRWQRGEPVLARDAGRAYRAWRFACRHTLALASATAVVVSLAAGAVVATWQAAVARDEARTAAAVQAFLEGVFRSSSSAQDDPVRARQRTARELLDAGTARIDHDLAGEPKVQLRVLRTLAAMYAEMAESEAAARLLDRIVELEQSLHPRPGAERVQSLAAASTAHIGAGDERRATERLAQARAMLAELPPDREAELAVQLAAFDISYHRRDPAGIAAGERALALLPASPSPRRRDVLGRLGGLHASAGRPQLAAPLLREAVAMHAALATPDGRGRVAVLRELALVEADLGRYRAADAALRAAIADEAQRIGDDSAAVARIRSQHAALLSAGGAPREALATFEALRQRSRQRPGESTQVAHDLAFDTHREAAARFAAGEPSRALVLLDGLQPGPSSGVFLAIDWKLLRARVLADLGRFDAARAELAAAETMRRERGVTSMRVQRRAHRAAVEVALAGADIAEAAARLAAPPAGPVPSSALADAAELMLLRGDAAGAAAAAQEALAATTTREADVDAAYAVQRLHELAGRAALAQGDAARAREAFERALAADAAMRDTGPRRLRSLAWLGQALWHSGDRAAARRQAAAARAELKRTGPLGIHHLQPLIDFERLQRI